MIPGCGAGISKQESVMGDQQIKKMAVLMRSAHLQLDILAKHLQCGEREQVEELCQRLRNSYQAAFEDLKARQEFTQ